MQQKNKLGQKEKIYNNLYLLKAIAAMMVVAVHANPIFKFMTSVSLDNFYGVYSFATLRLGITGLAFFFAVSGYLTGFKLSQKQAPDKYIFKQLKRVIWLCIKWSLIALSAEFLVGILVKGNTAGESIGSIAEHLNKFSIYYSVLGYGNHLWYLNALVFILIGFFVIRKLKLIKPILIVSFLLLVFAVVKANTNLISFEIMTRDALFYGMFYFLYGYYLSTRQLKAFGKRDAVILLIGLILLMFEGLIYTKIFGINYGEIYLSCVIFIYPLIKLGVSPNLAGDKSLIVRMGKQSDYIYFLHYIIINIIFAVAEVLKIKHYIQNTLGAVLFGIFIYLVTFYSGVLIRKRKLLKSGEKLNKSPKLES